jgi:hypothetical protein
MNMPRILGYSDQLCAAMRQCGLSVNPVINRAGQPALRFDALEIAENLVTFLWLGKPVFMVKRDTQQLVHLWGEIPLSH